MSKTTSSPSQAAGKGHNRADNHPGAVLVTSAQAPGAEVFTYEDDKYFCAYGYKSPRTRKKTFHFRFTSEKLRADYIESFFESLRPLAEYHALRKEKASLPNPAKVGDIWVYAWGYDQTNQDFFRVLKVTPRKVVFVPIGQRIEKELEFMAEYVMPCPDQFNEDEAFSKLIQFDQFGKPCVRMAHGICVPWDGHKRYQSHYA